MDLVWTKVVSMAIMLVTTFCFGMFPLQFRKLVTRLSKSNKNNDIYQSAVVCFGAGVLMATVFLHLLPEFIEEVEENVEKGFLPETDYPIGYLFICLGFFFMYILEEVVHTFVHNMNHENHSHRDLDSIEMQESAPSKPHDSHVVNLDESTRTLRAILVILALSAHSVMEGLSVGLQRETQHVWLMFAAISAHKLVIAFSIGMELLQSGVSLRSFVVYMTIFSIMSPLGGVIGSLILDFTDLENKGGAVTVTILTSFSAGTIVYVTFCEILERERQKERGSRARLIGLSLGFTVMALLMMFDVD